MHKSDPLRKAHTCSSTCTFIINRHDMQMGSIHVGNTKQFPFLLLFLPQTVNKQKCLTLQLVILGVDETSYKEFVLGYVKKTNFAHLYLSCFLRK